MLTPANQAGRSVAGHAVGHPLAGGAGELLFPWLGVVAGDLGEQPGAGGGERVDGRRWGLAPSGALRGPTFGAGGGWPLAIRRSRKQAGSMNAAPRVGQAQSTIHVACGAISTFSGLKSVCSRVSPSSQAQARSSR